MVYPMSDPNNGTYPQAAGSFYNSSAMMPHSGGRVAPQVPTYGEGLPGLMNASRMQISNPNTPRGSSIIASRSANMEAYYRAQDSSIGTATTGLNVMSGITAVGGFFGSTLLANPITGLGLGVGMAMASSALDRFAKEKEKIRSVQNALSGLNLVGNSMGDSLTGSINYSSATQISNSIHSRVGGFKSEDLKGVMDYAAKTGALTGYTNNPKQLTDRIVQLAKVTKEIVDIGDGITAADAANMQTMLSGMGINANTISKKSIGKRLVMAGRTAGLSLEEVNNLAQTSGQAYTQMGLSATQGVLAGAHAASSAKTLMGIGTLSEKDIYKLGGQSGLQQGLFKAGSASMSNLSQRLIMGTMKMSDKGEMIIDQDLLDMAVSGRISLEDLDARANKQMKRISKLDSRNRKLMMEQIQRSMPDLAEQVSENINAEQQMTLAGRGIQELRDKGMSTKSAMESFFGGDQQAIKAFTEYAKNLPSILQEQKRQNYLAEQDKLLARASQSIDYSELHSDNALTRTFKAISDDYDYAVNLVFDPEGRARRSLMREEKNKYRNLGFANGINDNSILSNILRNNGITRNAYTLTTEDLMQFSGRELNTAISTKATGDIFSSNLLQGDTFNTLSSNAYQGYSLKDFENQELLSNQTGGRSQYYGSVINKAKMNEIAADADALRKDLVRKSDSGQALSATDYTKGDITFNKDLNTFSVRRRVGDADFTELGGYTNRNEFMMTNKAGVAGGIGRFLTIDPSLDPEDPSNRSKPLSGLLNDILYEDTEDILGIGYGDRFMDIRNKLKGEYYDSGTLEMTSKLFGGNYFDSDATAEDAVTTITKAGRSYLKMFGENNNTLEANKAKLNLDIRGWNNTVEGNRKKDTYLNLRKRLSRRIEEQTTSTFSSTDDLSSLNYEAVEDMLRGEHLSPEEKQAMIQMVLKDIKDGTYDSQFGAVGSNVKRGAAKVEEAFQLAASVTKMDFGLDKSKLTKLAVDLGSEFTELNKVFDNREGSNEQLRKLMALVTTGEGDKVNTSNMQEMLRDLAARGINLTKKQAAAAAAFLQKTSGVRAGGKQNKEDLDKLFDMLNKGGNNISVKDNIESLISAGNTEKFLQEAKSYAEQGNELSRIVVKSIEAKNSDTNINATSDMGAKLINSGRTIRQLMGAEYDSLSEQQKNEISRMESKANRETNPDIKANSLGRAVALAQQYMQQNQANQTGEGGSKSLPAVMTEISQGITTFNDTMTQLKNALSNQGSTMTITLNK
jgi:hypothetical protein